jgi:hypothetical protein
LHNPGARAAKRKNSPKNDVLGKPALLHLSRKKMKTPGEIHNERKVSRKKLVVSMNLLRKKQVFRSSLTQEIL